MARHQAAKLKLQQTLILLLDNETFDHITVSKICRQAAVNRSTFYSYYSNQYELLEDAYDYLTSLFIAEFEEYQDDFNMTDETRFIDDAYLIPYLTFVKNHQRIYKIYLEHEHDFHHKERFDRLVNHIFKPSYYAHGVTDKVKMTYMASFFLAGITQVIRGWISNDCSDDISFISEIIQTCIPNEDK